MMRAVPLILLLLLALGVFACGDDAPAPGLSGELRYVKTGGFAGDHIELMVQPDGRATVKSRRGGDSQFTLTEEELAALSTEADTLVDGDDQPAKPAPDAFVHTVEYRGRKLTTTDAAGGGQPSIVSELQKILQAHGG